MTTMSPLKAMSEHDESAFQHSSPPHSTPPFTHDPHRIDAEDGPTSDDDAITRITVPPDAWSSRSSISSLPASTFFDHNDVDCRTPSKPMSVMSGHNSPRSGSRHSVRTPVSERKYPTGFRNPSSVRAMQMRDELFDETDDPTPHLKRRGSRMSYLSHQSIASRHTSPTKRTSHSNQSSARKSENARKEFPLVLLHCTLLPTSPTLWEAVSSEDLLADVLPTRYKKRWMALYDRMTRNPEMQARGVLIPHPKDDYELLEERLLESLELERPRIRQHHFISGGSGADSGFESASQSEEEVESDHKNGQRCPDCGKEISVEAEQERQWEIKIYAGNGLMRSGAWIAAWQEMERVDVEIGVWMPEEIRRAMDLRLAELEFQSKDHNPTLGEDLPQSAEDIRMREIYGDQVPERTQEEIDGFQDEAPAPSTQQERSYSHTEHIPPGHQQYLTSQTFSTPSILDLALKHLKSLLDDRRNVLIAILSAVVLWYAFNLTPKAQSQVPEVQPTTTGLLSGFVTSHTATSTLISTSVEVSTATVTATITTEVPNLAVSTQVAVPSMLETDLPVASSLIDQNEDAMEFLAAEPVVDVSQTVEVDEAEMPATQDQEQA